MRKHSSKKLTLRKAAMARLGKTPIPPPHDNDDLLHELRVHQIELEMQNELLRQTHITLEESRDRYVNLYDFAPVGYITLSTEGLVIEANLAVASLLNVERSKLARHRFVSFIDPSQQERWNLGFSLLWQNRVEQKHHYELLLKRADGSVFDAQLQCVVINTAYNPSVVRIAISDITQRKRAEEERRIAAIAFESQEGMMVTNAEGVIISVNQAFTILTGYSAIEAVSKTPALLRSHRHDKAFYQTMWQSLKLTHYWQGEVWNRRKNGEDYAAWLTITAVTTPEGCVTHYVGAFSDTTQQSEAAAEIHRLAYYDPLTHLPNRRLLQDRLSQALTASHRSGIYGAILFLDLDNFKILNDTRGHHIGDVLLQQVSQRLRLSLREGDTVARLGGDEFVMIVEHLNTDAAKAALLAKRIGEKLIISIAHPFVLAGIEFHCTTSIGICMFCTQDTVETLLQHADLALYKGKSEGRNVVRFYDPSMQATIDARSKLENELYHALEREQFRLYFQPQLDRRQRVIGAEALLRWQHPQRGLVNADDFISLAEQTGLILPIGRWVLESACAQLNSWSHHEHTRDLLLSVNISARQFSQTDFVDQVQCLLARSAADPGHLIFELTESLLMENVNDTIQKMQALKNLGIHFSIDDFGTGFSSFSYLTRLLLDQLKVDKSFVTNLPDHNAAAIVVTAITTMAKSLGLSVLAEGVETQAQHKFLENLGCHAYQGYLFSRPLPQHEFIQFVQTL
ncbi:MAG: EAL domain-containing protein [Gammaproteobacteria bacterium]|nr:EAL domain-containing protein [Gammaproteobacteria bacterium]